MLDGSAEGDLGKCSGCVVALNAEGGEVEPVTLEVDRGGAEARFEGEFGIESGGDGGGDGGYFLVDNEVDVMDGAGERGVSDGAADGPESGSRLGGCVDRCVEQAPGVWGECGAECGAARVSKPVNCS